jgi:TPR repeat protein
LRADWVHQNEREKPPAGRSEQAASRRRSDGDEQGRRNKKQETKQGSRTMARFDMAGQETAAMGGQARAEALCDMGLMYATGRGCPVDLVSAHKWLNIAAIKGSDRAAELRADLVPTMTKMQLAEALRAARDWMTVH